jgi:glycosyltransferase involved in cell wall biosynthesis
MSQKQHICWIIAFNFGSVKAGPVIRFMRYAPYFEREGVKTVFITKNRCQDISKEFEGFEVRYLDCEDSVSLTRQAIDAAVESDNKPNSMIFLSIDHHSYFDLKKAKINKIKLIYVSTMHFDLRFKEFGTKRGLLSRIILFIFLNRTFSLFNQIVCSTNLLKHDFLKLGIPDALISVIYNGVDIQKFTKVDLKTKLQLREKYGLNTEKVVLLFVGLFVERKGVDYLVRLYEKFIVANPNNKSILLMVGDEMLDINENSEEFKKRWTNLRKKAEKDGLVQFHNFSKDIHEYYKMADIFIFPSKLEGMPNVLIESMASGLPILVNRFEGFSEDYGKAGNEYDWICYEVEKDLYNLTNFVFDLEKRNHFGSNALIHARKNFDLIESVHKYITLLK